MPVDRLHSELHRILRRADSNNRRHDLQAAKMVSGATGCLSLPYKDCKISSDEAVTWLNLQVNVVSCCKSSGQRLGHLGYQDEVLGYIYYPYLHSLDLYNMFTCTLTSFREETLNYVSHVSILWCNVTNHNRQCHLLYDLTNNETD